ncbi:MULTISPECIES: lmo0954 family membrane protein [Salimicrobium]|uniref:Flagellar basal body rod protein n=1 Tax=Salimicrobium humidisoli TaxID=2029857 RepID=A0ABX4HP05_9BACI|nr:MULTISPECIES: flagellar basal body rod protein [Salimicrobium]PBB04803.1 flagellar basal body rod protein [Salimicrobium humidisoli]
MKQFLLFIGALTALAIIVASLGPLIMLAVGIWLLYLVYRQFTRTDSAGGKIGWLIIGLLVLAFITPHLPALIGVAAAYGLYLVYRSWKKEEAEPEDDPFTNFEKQWKQLQ